MDSSSKRQKACTDLSCPVRDEILKWAVQNKKKLFSKLSKAVAWPGATCSGKDTVAEVQYPIYNNYDEDEIVGFTDLYLCNGDTEFHIMIKSKVVLFGEIMRELKLHRKSVWQSNKGVESDFHTAFVLLAPSIPFADLIREDGCFPEEIDRFLVLDYHEISIDA